MPIAKSLLMKSGVTATFWKITQLSVDIQGLTSSFKISPFLDESHATARAKPVGPSKFYSFTITEEQALGGSIDDVYEAILDKAASEVPNIGSDGTHIFDPDLADGTIV